MNRKILCILLCALMILPTYAVAAAESENEIYFSENFSSYAENEQSIGKISVNSGVDSRVSSTNGDKAFFSRAFGEPVKVQISLPSSSESTKAIFSARIMMTGAKTTGNLFTAEYSKEKYNFLCVDTNGYLKLADGKIVGGVHGHFKTVTIAADFENSVFDLYIDKKCVASQWDMPASVSEIPSALSWSVDFTDNAETDLYLDDIRVYDGEKLPWEKSFHAQPENKEVLEFTPTESFDASSEVLQAIEFSGSLSGISAVKAEGDIKSETDAEGVGYARLTANNKSNGGTYFDVSSSSLREKAKYVVDIRFKVNELSGSAGLGMLDSKNSDGNWRLGYMINADGSITSRTTAGGVGTYKKGKWMRYSFAYDIYAGKVDIYCDGEQVNSEVIPADFFPTMFRFDLYNKPGNQHDTSIDWIRIYTGAQLQGDEFFVKDSTQQTADVSKTQMDPADKLKAALKNKIVFMTNNDTMYIDGKKQSYENDSFKPYIVNGSLMMPRNMFSLFSFDEISLDEASGEISVGTRAKMKLGEKAYVLDGVQKELNAAPALQNGVLYFPLRGMAEQLLSKKVTWDPRGMVVVADEEMEIDEVHYLDRFMQWKDADLIYRFMQFENPDGAKMVEDLKASFPNQKHPRILYTSDDINYILDNMETDSILMDCYNDVLRSANGIVATDYSTKLNVTTETKQLTAAGMQGVVQDIATAYLLTGDAKYAEKGIEIVKSFCSWDDLDYGTANLIAGHWAAIVAIGYDSFYNYMAMTESGKKDLEYIRNAAEKLAILPHIDGYAGAAEPHWITMQDNFLGVCGGGMMMLMLAMADEEQFQGEAQYLLNNLYRSMQIATGLFYPNGGYYEGVSYLSYMFTCLTPALNAMFNCFGTDYGLGLAKGFKEAGYMLTYLQSTDTYFNFHDTNPGFNFNSVAELMAYRYNDPQQGILVKNQKTLGGWDYDLQSYFFYRKATDGKDSSFNVSDAPLDRYFGGVEAGAFHSSHEVSNPTFAGFHGGYTGIPHDMLDLGEFVFEADNVIWACDLGRDNYDLPGYFSVTDYLYYRKRPEGENCIVLNPSVGAESYYGQKVGAKAELIDCDMNKQKGAKAAYDLSEAYERDASKYIRGYYFGDDRNTLTVQDEISLKGKTELYWFMTTAQSIEIVNNNKAILKSADGKTLVADVYCSENNFTLKEMPCEPLPASPNPDGQDKNQGYRKLAIHVPQTSGNITISVKLSPETGEYKYTPLTVTPIESWSIPEGERTTVPRLSALYANGELLSDFEVGSKRFTVTLPYGTQQAPVIEAKSTVGEVSIIQPTSLETPATVILSGDGMITQEIKIDFKVSTQRDITVEDALVDIQPIAEEKGIQIIPKSASGLTLPEPENPPEKMLDGDFSSRGTQEGTNLWFEFDLGEVMDIGGVSVAFYDGNLRQFIFDLLYSEDGINFKRVWSGKSLGTSNGYETIAVPGKARYIRYIGNGNTSSEWNSITEFRAFK